MDRKEPPFRHSLAAIAKHPAPDRKYYFTGSDYAAACMRVHEKRLDYDKKASVK